MTNLDPFQPLSTVLDNDLADVATTPHNVARMDAELGVVATTGGLTLSDFQSINDLYGGDTIYLAVLGGVEDTTAKVCRYLNDPPLISQVPGHPAWVTVMPRRQGRFYVDRLDSALIRGSLHDTLHGALEYIGQVLAARP